MTEFAEDTIAIRLRSHREAHLEEAVDDTLRWLNEAEVEGAPGERHWLDRFADWSDISADDAKRHRHAWQISHFHGKFDYAAVAHAFRSAARMPHAGRMSVAATVTDVEALAAEIGAAALGKRRRQISWASKALFYIRPEAPVFIYDQHARRAVDFWAQRYPDRATCRAWGPSATYAAYASRCEALLAELRGDRPFMEALGRAERGLRSPTPAILAADFLARRLLDKFLFHQGTAIRDWKDAARAGVGAKGTAAGAAFEPLQSMATAR